MLHWINLYDCWLLVLALGLGIKFSVKISWILLMTKPVWSITSWFFFLLFLYPSIFHLTTRYTHIIFCIILPSSPKLRHHSFTDIYHIYYTHLFSLILKVYFKMLCLGVYTNSAVLLIYVIILYFLYFYIFS